MFNWFKNLFKSKSVTEVRKRVISDYEFNAMRSAKEKKAERCIRRYASTLLGVWIDGQLTCLVGTA